MSPSAFQRYVGIDYSGAETPDSSLRGLRIYSADCSAKPTEVLPPPSPRRYWTRRSLAGWVKACLSEGVPTVVGIDHGFSFPLNYFEAHGLKQDWGVFLNDFREHWPTDKPYTYVDFVREGECGKAVARRGDSRWRRITEARAGAKSVFHFDVPGSVAKSTHAGLPWLDDLRRSVEGVHFWPFDGWTVSAGCSVVAEVYPSLWSGRYAKEGRTPDQHGAYTVAAWLQETDRSGKLPKFLKPELSPEEKMQAEIEGWILGVM